MNGYAFLNPLFTSCIADGIVCCVTHLYVQ